MRWIKPVVVSIIVVITSVWALSEMRLYLAAPSVRAKVWDKSTKKIRAGWSPNDDLAFHPSWISGYVLDRRRLHGLVKSSDPVRNVFKADPERNVWLVTLFATQRYVDQVDQEFTALETHQFGDVRVQKLRRKSP